MESRLSSSWIPPKNALFNGRIHFSWLANTEPPFPKLAGSNFKSYWIHAGQVRRKVDYSKFSLEFNFVRIAAQKESPALQQGKIHVEKWIPPLRGLCSKNLAEFDFYRIWLAASVFIYLCITRTFVTDTK